LSINYEPVHILYLNALQTSDLATLSMLSMAYLQSIKEIVKTCTQKLPYAHNLYRKRSETNKYN